MKKYTALSAITLFLITTLSAQVPGMRPQSDSSAKAISVKLDEYMTVLAKAYKFSGSILVAQKGHILLEKGYGWRNIAARQLNDENGIFQIGSLTKPFTAEVILKLQEQDRLSVHDKLSGFSLTIPMGTRSPSRIF